MSLSTLTYYGGDIADPSQATPGLFNRRFSAISRNVDELNEKAGQSLATQLFGGTGLTSTVTGDLLLGRSSTSALSTLPDVVAAQVLKSGGVGADPAYSPQYVQTMAGTANQISASASTGDVVVSLPSALTVPGGLQATNAAYFPAGSAVLPGVAFTSERSLGLYRSAASVLALSYGTFVASQVSSLATSWTSNLIVTAPMSAGTMPFLAFATDLGIGLRQGGAGSSNAATMGTTSGMTFDMGGGGRASSLTVTQTASVKSYLYADGELVCQVRHIGNANPANSQGRWVGDTSGGDAFFPGSAGGFCISSKGTVAVGYTTPPAASIFAVKGDSEYSGYVWAQGTGTGASAGGFFMAVGTALRPTIAFVSEQSLGWFSSSASRMALSYGYLNLPTNTPASGTAAGTTGDVTWDASYVYVCSSTSSWRRAALSAF